MKNIQRSFILFEGAIKSEVTRKSYLYQLEKFRKWAKIKNYDSLLEAPQNNIQEILEDYILHLKKTVSPNSVSCYFAPIQLFYIMNDVEVNFKKLRRLFPAQQKKANGRGYTHQEINQILQNARSKRNKALVLFFASSGVRLGAIEDIRLKHMSRIENCYSILIYEGSTEEAHIFTTPEATKAIDEYFEERKKDGEYFTGDSPLFRTAYRLGIEKVKALKTNSLSRIMRRLVSCVERKKVTKKRYDIPQNHGFRKFFATVIKNILGITSTMTEKLINHIGVVQLDGSYFTPSINDMFDAYKKTISNLTINQTEKQQVKIKELEKEKLELQKERLKSEQLEDRIKRLEQIYEQR